MNEPRINETGTMKAERVTLVRGGRRIVDTVDLTLHPGTITVIVGPNGAGKSSLLKCLTGELSADSGTIRLSGRELNSMPTEELARHRAVLPQESRLAFDFSVEELILLGRAPFAESSSASEDRAILENCLRRTDLETFRDRLFTTLSGGEQQRAQLSRVLAQRAGSAEHTVPFLFLDEPTSSLDIKHQMDVLAIAREEARHGATVLVILHDINLAANVADQLIMMKAGRIARQGFPQTILTPDSIRDVFEVKMKQIESPHHTAPLFFPNP